MARLRLGLLLAFCAALAACGQDTAAPPARAYTVEELAEKAGCTPEFQGKSSDFRQAACATDASRYMLLDFSTDAKKREWLDNALIYGAPYLVGEKWVLTSVDPADMERLRSKVGGTLEQDTSMGATHHG